MKKVLRSATALAAVMVAAPVAAHATDGWYGRVDAGYSFDGGLDLSQTPAGANTLNGTGELDEDWSEHLGLGYAFTNGFRLEGEVGHRFNRLEPFGTGLPTTDPSLATGDVHVWSAMVNAFFDLNKGGSFQPYIGLGVGAAQVNAHAASVGNVSRFDDESTSLAYQGLAGAAFSLSPQLSLDIGYRYFVVPELEFDGLAGGGSNIPASIDGDYDQHAATIGLRWQFAAPTPPAPPPPPPAPPPPTPVVQVCPVNEFKVYFEWDRSNLNADAVETINSAAARAKECNVSTVRVVGYTDTSGSPRYNIGLSNRRAAVVRDALVAAGIPATLIATEGLGETNLDKATADGVREPLNRRTAVTISFQ